MYRTTREAAALVPCTLHQLAGAIRNGKLSPAPPKTASGDYIWTDSDIARARAALAVDRRRGRRVERMVPVQSFTVEVVGG